jgi:hypothetical protein
MRARLVLVGVATLGTWGTGPRPVQQQAGTRCRIELLNVDREGNRVEVTPGVVNYFAGGNIRARCQGQQIFMWSESLAVYQGRVWQFIGRVRYRDSTTEMTASFGTYFRDTDKWEARENVVLRNQKDGTTLRGPMVDYYRSAPSAPSETELYADRRPTVTLPVRDTLGAEEEPYVVVGDRVRTRGQNRIWAGGGVTIDRSDFRGRGDSLYLDTGTGHDGALIGNASARRAGADSFDLTGGRIDLALADRELTAVTARDSAQLATGSLHLVGDGIWLDLEHRKVEQTLAWGDSVRPVARSEDYLVRGDSLAFDTPRQQLREIRAFGGAWLGAKPDSAGERDWVEGDTVTATFVPRDSGGITRPALQRLASRGEARAFYRMRLAGQTGTSISYTIAREIRIVMRVADTVTVDSVIALGVVDGVHLQPGLTPRDTTRRDTTGATPVVPPQAGRTSRR